MDPAENCEKWQLRRMPMLEGVFGPRKRPLLTLTVEREEELIRQVKERMREHRGRTLMRPWRDRWKTEESDMGRENRLFFQLSSSFLFFPSKEEEPTTTTKQPKLNLEKV